MLVDRQVDLKLAPGLPVLYVDGREIEVVLMNLIENAVKYSDPGTPITIRTQRLSDQVIFGVEDRGVGIPGEHLLRIFERFYRVNGGMAHVPGTGLGLAICKRIIEAHRGQIWAESAPGYGSRFYFSLPIERPGGERSDG
jgi:two-component system sensor histidine kinase KdpD